MDTERLDPEHCYRALAARDRRFDGRFFVGVASTGIYCRPVCPARTPKQTNCTFYPSAAAAETAGFRPCLRCRPETAPGSPAWTGTSATVARAMRLIAEGALDDASVEELAARVGIGGRHLRRLFRQELGTTPAAAAQTHRAHLAKKLLDETSLSMGQVALAAGYRDVRRFNAGIRRSWQRSPTELRRQRAQPAAAESVIRLRLAYRPPLDWEEWLGFLRPRLIPGVETIDGATYRRGVSTHGVSGVIALSASPRDDSLLLQASLSLAPALPALVERARVFADLRADPGEIAAHLRRDPRLRTLVRRRPGLRIPGAWDPFETAVRAVLGQQVTVAAATTLAGRIVARFGAPAAQGDGDEGGSTLVAFPAAAVLAGADLSGLGLTEARIRTVTTLAGAVADGTLDLSGAADPAGQVRILQTLPGIGPWTAAYIAMRVLGDPDAFPASDLGLLKALETEGVRPAPAAAERIAETWRPWRSYAVMHLWAAALPRSSQGEKP
ncbi:MAG TPA: AlkA N-terminal domain-containing protein [Candidatus Krumholzibacteria bacterium]|nr:AlkA N-terminal domain-containing protein [Candidatus Krumholzibacteria bacterium]